MRISFDFFYFLFFGKKKKKKKKRSLPGTTLDEDQRCLARPKSATLTAGVFIEEAGNAVGAGVAGEEAPAAKEEAEEAE